MSVSENDVTEGKYFKTSSNQIRRVMEVKDGSVRYAAGGADFRNRNWDHSQWQKMDAFITAVDGEVEDTWDPNYQHPRFTEDDAPDDSES
jgi:hypothetical protein